MAEALTSPLPPMELTVATLDEQLSSLVHWEKFGLQLRGVKNEDIETIKIDHYDNSGRKLALYTKWLSVCTDASWSDVVIALEKAGEITLAEHIRLHFYTGPQHQRDEEIIIPLQDEDAVIVELKSLHTTYTTLFTETREHIEELIETNQLSLQKIASRLEDVFHSLSVKGLGKCKEITEIFDILREHCHSLDSSVLELVIETVIGKSDLLQKVTEHNKRVRQFKMTQPIKLLKDQLKENKIGKNHIPLTITLNVSWEKIYISLVENLIRTLLQLKGDIQWISVVPGSVQIIIAVPIEEEHTIIATCSQKEDFMKQMGISYLQIGTNTILDTKEDNQYLFESGLLEACAIGTIETVQFLLHYQFIQHIDIDHTNPQDGQTPLMIASKNGHGNIVKLLLSAKANVNKQDNTGCTAVIKHDEPENAEQQKMMTLFNNWVKENPDTPWSDVVRALETIRENRLAEKIQSKCVTKDTDTNYDDSYRYIMPLSAKPNDNKHKQDNSGLTAVIKHDVDENAGQQKMASFNKWYPEKSLTDVTTKTKTFTSAEHANIARLSNDGPYEAPLQKERNTQLDVRELYDHLEDLVEWEIFGTYLRKIKQSDIDKIKRNEAGNIDRQKLALCNKWLSVCPDASWRDVTIALVKTNKFISANIENPDTPWSDEPYEAQPCIEIKLTEIEEITIISKLQYFSSKFSELLTKTRNHIEELIESNQMTLHYVASKLEEALHFLSITRLTNCKSVKAIFDNLQEYNHFLDGGILKLIIEKLFNSESSLLQEINDYVDKIRAFKLLETIANIRNKLNESKLRNSQILKIKLNNNWEQMYIELVKNLIRTLLQLKGDIPWISVMPD